MELGYKKKLSNIFNLIFDLFFQFSKEELKSTRKQNLPIVVDQIDEIEVSIFTPKKEFLKSKLIKKSEKVEQKFLKSKPTCFLVIGKPGVGKTTIANKLAKDWKAELVNRKILIVLFFPIK